MALSHPVQPAPWGEYVPNTGVLTVAQFEALSDVDGWEFELHEGRLIRMPGPGGTHMQQQSQLFLTVGVFLQQHNLGRLLGTGCYILPLPTGEEILCPDLSYVTPDRANPLPKRGSYVNLVPDWVIEIASPSDYRPQMQQKMQVYLSAGVRLAWVIWPNSQIVDIWRPGDTTLPSRIATPADTLDGADVAPGLSLTMADLFDF